VLEVGYLGELLLESLVREVSAHSIELIKTLDVGFATLRQWASRGSTWWGLRGRQGIALLRGSVIYEGHISVGRKVDKILFTAPGGQMLRNLVRRKGETGSGMIVEIRPLTRQV
jgi:hypothetical protein